MEQSTISVYCDMSLMLAYKAVYQTALTVATQMGAAIKQRISGNYTAREDLITASPLKIEEVSIFNPTGGYGSSVIPAVLMLILQQTLALGVGMAAGTARERSRYSDLVPINRCYSSVGRIISGKSLVYLMIYAVMSTYLAVVVPRMFNFLHMATWQSLLMLMIPYLLACVFFGMTVSCLVRYRENVILLVVFVSLPLLFLTGVSWPQTSIPGYLQGVSWLFPSTFGIRAYLRLNSMGASIADVSSELRCLWIQVAAYLGAACLVYGHQLRTTRQHASERLDYLRKKREVRQALKKRQ
jgi:ABC-2 type transport system permease protein